MMLVFAMLGHWITMPPLHCEPQTGVNTLSLEVKSASASGIEGLELGKAQLPLGLSSFLLKLGTSVGHELAPTNVYVVGRELGRGAGGLVYRVEQETRLGKQLLDHEKRSYALKVIRRQRNQDGDRSHEQLLQEIKSLHRAVDHDFAVKIVHWFIVESDHHLSVGGTYHGAILMELCEEGDLGRYICKREETRWTGWTSEQRVKIMHRFAAELAEVLWYLHDEQGIVVRDVKPANVLLRFGQIKDPQQLLHVCLADFGAANYAEGMGTLLGTPGYAAPEIIKMLPVAGPGGDARFFGVRLDMKVDVYSFAVTVLRMMGVSDFDRWKLGNDKLGKHKVFLDQWLQELSVAMRDVCNIDIISRCLETEPENRPDMAEVRDFFEDDLFASGMEALKMDAMRRPPA